jgi:hypothetical protein
MNGLLERLMSRVSRGPGEEDCWLFTGPVRGSNGYGAIEVEGVLDSAHRVSWTLHVGPIPPGRQVLHDCPTGDNPLCINPAHLWLGTHAQNMADRNRKRRQARGERVGVSKLTEAQVIAIRQLAASGERQRDIAKRIGVTQATVSRLVRGEAWVHVAKGNTGLPRSHKSSSRIPGVSYESKRKLWRAYSIQKSGKRREIGRFRTKEEAAAAVATVNIDVVVSA